MPQKPLSAPKPASAPVEVQEPNYSRKYECVVKPVTYIAYRGLYADPFYHDFSGPEINIPLVSVKNDAELDKVVPGITIISAEASMLRIGGDHQHGDWTLDTVNFEAKRMATTEFVGASIGGSLFEVGAGIYIPIPFTDQSLYIGGEAVAFGAGAEIGFSKDEGATVKAVALFGVGLNLNIAER